MMHTECKANFMVSIWLGGIFKAKQLVVDPSEGRGVFHTRARKASAGFTMLRPPAACMEGCVSVCQRV